MRHRDYEDSEDGDISDRQARRIHREANEASKRFEREKSRRKDNWDRSRKRGGYTPESSQFEEDKRYYEDH